MKKVRGSKKDPSKLLRAIEIQPPSARQYEHKRQYTGILKIGERSADLHEQRSCGSSFNQEKSQRYHSKKSSLSPRQLIRGNHSEVSRNSFTKRSFLGTKDIGSKRYGGSSKSPYLKQHTHNSSDKKIYEGPIHLSCHKINRPIRLNSLEHRSYEQDEKDRKVQEILHEAKVLMMKGENRKSILMFQKVLKSNPSNPDALFGSLTNWYHTKNYQKTIQNVEKLHEIDPSFNIQMYLLWAKALDKLDQKQSALSKLNQCLTQFPHSEEAYYGKGSLLLKLKLDDEAEKCFLLCLAFKKDYFKAYEKLVGIYSSRSLYVKVLDIIERAMKECKMNEEEEIKFEEVQCSALLSLGKNERIIQKFSGRKEGAVLFYVGKAHYRLSDHLKAYLALQNALNSSFSAQAAKLMLLLKIQQNDFYQSFHLLERCRSLQLQQCQNSLQSLFIEGVIFLMRRNIEEGIQKLNKILHNNYKKYQYDQSSKYILPLVHTYIAYGYYCQGKFKECLEQYQEQKQKYKRIFCEGMQYNMTMVEGYVKYNEGQLKEAKKYFMQGKEINGRKLEPYFCLAVCEFNEGKQKNEEEKSYKKSLEYLQSASELIKHVQNNNAANIFYHRSLLHASLKQWREALFCIDETIQKSEQNEWKHFYVRALILACIHNFPEAINDCSIAINLQPSNADPFFLRSSCFQIEGQGSNAFHDLQYYISLRPNDKLIHLYAGKILFENGAFEDAISAFEHQIIEEVISNIDAFLTKSKTYFLIGQFARAAEEMIKIYQIDSTKQHIQFDAYMMGILQQILNSKSQPQYHQILTKIDKKYEQEDQQKGKQRIFKQTQKHTLKAICHFQLQDYQETVKQLSQAIRMKKKIVLKQNLVQASGRQDDKDIRMFVGQMCFNRSLCYIMMGKYQMAISEGEKICVVREDAFYQNYVQFMTILKGKYPPGHQSEFAKLEVFPSRNKISNFLKQKEVVFEKGSKYMMRMSIPFPKVQPPEIFPEFDHKLLQFSINGIDRKPEAPWIHKQDNAVNFTGKVQKYSRLEIQDSLQDNNSSSPEIDHSHLSMSSIQRRKTGDLFVKIHNQ